MSFRALLTEITKSEQNIIEILSRHGISEEDAHDFFIALKNNDKGWSLKANGSGYIYLKKTIPKTSIVDHDKHKKGMRNSFGAEILRDLLDKYKIKHTENYSVSISGGMTAYYKVVRTMNVIIGK